VALFTLDHPDSPDHQAILVPNLRGYHTGRMLSPKMFDAATKNNTLTEEKTVPRSPRHSNTCFKQTF